jgi:protein-tyrosine phosphatase
MAAGMLKHRLKEEGLNKWVKVDSAATHGDMLGLRADERARRAAANVGVDLGRTKSRLVKPKDFKKFNYILAMDRSNYQDLIDQCQEGCQEKLALFMSFSPSSDFLDVPDPYYGSFQGFEKLLSIMEGAIDGLVVDLREVLEL